MAAIVTLTFSPCIDKSCSIPFLIPEKKLRCSIPKLEPGGGGINVSRAIHKFGIDVMAVFASGGYTGKYFNHLLETEGIPFRCIETENETRENIIIFDESTGNQYRFGMPPGFLSDVEWQKFVQEVEALSNAEFIIISGSMPTGAPSNIFSRLSKIAKSKKAKLVADTSGEALKQVACEGAYLLKPNLGELASLAGLPAISIHEAETVAQKVLEQYPVEILIVSAGSEGAMLFTKNETYKALAPQVQQKSTVGAGDSMLAGIICSLSNRLPLHEALQFGVACGTAATMNPGTELCNPGDARNLLKKIKLYEQAKK